MDCDWERVDDVAADRERQRDDEEAEHICAEEPVETHFDFGDAFDEGPPTAFASGDRAALIEIKADTCDTLRRLNELRRLIKSLGVEHQSSSPSDCEGTSVSPARTAGICEQVQPLCGHRPESPGVDGVLAEVLARIARLEDAETALELRMQEQHALIWERLRALTADHDDVRRHVLDPPGVAERMEDFEGRLHALEMAQEHTSGSLHVVESTAIDATTRALHAMDAVSRLESRMTASDDVSRFDSLVRTVDYLATELMHIQARLFDLEDASDGVEI